MRAVRARGGGTKSRDVAEPDARQLFEHVASGQAHLRAATLRLELLDAQRARCRRR